MSLSVFTQTPILQALQHVQASCDEAHKMRYIYSHRHTQTITSQRCCLRLIFPVRFSDLFALAEEYEDSQTKPPKSRRKAPASSPRSRKGVAPPTNNEEESASSSGSVCTPSIHVQVLFWFRSVSDLVMLLQEEEDSKPKAPKRKRKGSSAVGSDSD